VDILDVGEMVAYHAIGDTNGHSSSEAGPTMERRYASVLCWRLESG
jgi:hypothetical protein